jgi:hypothetical protein
MAVTELPTKNSQRKAMAEKRAPKRRAWNQGLEVGKRDGVKPAPVRCALSKASAKALEKWITASGKKPTDFSK